MSLVEKFDGLSDKTKYYCNASMAFVSMKVLDHISTVMCCNKHGIQNEFNPEARHLMEVHGIEDGMLIHTVGITAYCLGAAFVLNRLGESVSENSMLQNLGNIGLTVGSIYGAAIVANNFINYMN